MSPEQFKELMNSVRACENLLAALLGAVITIGLAIFVLIDTVKR